MGEFFNNLKKHLLDGEIKMVSASLAFSTALSIVPFFAVTLAFLHQIDGLESLYPKVESFILVFFKGTTGNDGMLLIKKAFNRIQAGNSGVFGAFFLVLTSMSLVNDIEFGINRIWNPLERRPLYKKIFLSWFFLISFPLILAVFAAGQSYYPFLANHSGEIQTLLLFSFLYVLYKYVPFSKVAASAAFMGALISGTALLITGSFFKEILQNLFKFNKVYGVIASLPAFLLIILLFWFLVLVGVAITSSLQNRSYKN